MTAEPCICHLVPRGGCRQGRACPVRESEHACSAPVSPDAPFPAPKGKRMNHRSSNHTLRFHRSMSDAFGCSMNDPVYPMPDRRDERAIGRRVSDAIAKVASVCRDALAALFGR